MLRTTFTFACFLCLTLALGEKGSAPTVSAEDTVVVKQLRTVDQKLSPPATDCAVVQCERGYDCQKGECVDIDECSLQTIGVDGTLVPICKPGDTCRNTPGSYECVPEITCANIKCAGGYECRDAQCIDIDECSLPTFAPICERGEVCRNTPGSYECVPEITCANILCRVGYECRDAQCFDIDECSLPTFAPICERGEVCRNTPGSYECVGNVPDCSVVQCPKGFYCSNGECRDTCEIIRIACEEGQVCRAGQCVDPPEEDPCNLIDCAPGFVCRGGRCVPDRPTDCSAVLCGPGTECQEGRCIPRRCRNDEMCDAGFMCEDEQCVDVNECQEAANVLHGLNALRKALSKEAWEKLSDQCDSDRLPTLCGSDKTCVNYPGGYECRGDEVIEDPDDGRV